jgi:hypothetical protein
VEVLAGDGGALGLGSTEEEVGHPYLGALNVGRRTKRLALLEHFIECVEVLVVDLFVVLVVVDDSVSRLPGHSACPSFFIQMP